MSDMMHARQEQDCAECPNPIQVGDLVRRVGREYAHMFCPKAQVCQKCWLLHNPGACDR